MNPMSDKLFRDWHASELAREITRETRIQAALHARQIDPATPIHPLQFRIPRWLVTMCTSGTQTVRHDAKAANRPAEQS